MRGTNSASCHVVWTRVWVCCQRSSIRRKKKKHLRIAGILLCTLWKKKKKQQRLHSLLSKNAIFGVALLKALIASAQARLPWGVFEGSLSLWCGWKIEACSVCVCRESSVYLQWVQPTPRSPQGRGGWRRHGWKEVEIRGRNKLSTPSSPK